MTEASALSGLSTTQPGKRAPSWWRSEETKASSSPTWSYLHVGESQRKRVAQDGQTSILHSFRVLERAFPDLGWAMAEG
jgi:hypothetical protein